MLLRQAGEIASISCRARSHGRTAWQSTQSPSPEEPPSLPQCSGYLVTVQYSTLPPCSSGWPYKQMTASPAKHGRTGRLFSQHLATHLLLVGPCNACPQVLKLASTYSPSGNSGFAASGKCMRQADTHAEGARTIAVAESHRQAIPAPCLAADFGTKVRFRSIRDALGLDTVTSRYMDNAWGTPLISRHSGPNHRR